MRIKAFNEFQAFVALNLKVICKGDYSHDHFLDSLVYDNKTLKLCIILTEERLLIVDAVEKTMIRDFTAQMLHSVESRPLYQQLSQNEGEQAAVQK